MISTLINAFEDGIAALQTWLYVDAVQPLLYHLGLMGYDEDAYDALYWVIVGVVQIAVMYAVLRPWEALMPAEKWSDRRATRVDVVYTWIAKLGVFNIAFFFLLQPWFDHLQSLMAIYGIPAIELETLWPGVTDKPLVSFLIYLVALDAAGYWYHRWQHRFGIWWELHAVHHSQRQMSLWTDDRNHVVDTLIQSAFFAGLSLLIGVEPGQYVALIAIGNLMQSLQHVNARIPFGRVLERIVVSPSFHRRHHAIGYGHEGTRYGCNFGVLLPWWDMLFRTASWDATVEPTGIRDQLPRPDGSHRTYGEGWWAQQGHAFVRIAHRLRVTRTSA
ncbi:sterol desaturase family protein [Dyella sp. C11]|uniref:sterol desaturase family protein n=1 Tax=Dyella sp. C11 TaxID=2126991 RepID=UPI000D642A86|nr:sterol desaturase family protein [Dyella sp. C11]